jgi:3D-(3,5/4)-trihydroxycyclohexane-1,2-dione acylhydrolase (decyclizing)
VDLAANAESLGAQVIRVRTIIEFREAIGRCRAATRTTAILIETDPLAPVPASTSWCDVPVGQVAALDSTQRAYQYYRTAKAAQRTYLSGGQ